jgi:hypothetical protein
MTQEPSLQEALVWYMFRSSRFFTYCFCETFPHSRIISLQSTVSSSVSKVGLRDRRFRT